jgi:hypothetical protein
MTTPPHSIRSVLVIERMRVSRGKSFYQCNFVGIFGKQSSVCLLGTNCQLAVASKLALFLNGKGYRWVMRCKQPEEYGVYISPMGSNNAP